MSEQAISLTPAMVVRRHVGLVDAVHLKGAGVRLVFYVTAHSAHIAAELGASLLAAACRQSEAEPESRQRP